MATVDFAAARRLAPRLLRWTAPRRLVEVRVLASGLEQDSFTASRIDTLVRALRPIERHLDGRAELEMVAVERLTSIFGSTERRELLDDLADAIAFLGRER